ncbi:MAG TPA: isochorismatase family cysteine hydrolase [Vicinamibacterales bacterium]|nr:isochorismatase family cysteine hydrolase [Vicinamibacterales bacterium]
MNDPTLDPRRTALLVMDFQRTIVERIAPDPAALLDRMARLLAAARAAGLRVIFVGVGFRDGYPEVSARNQSFATIRTTGAFLSSAAGSEIHPAVAPAEGEVVVTKHRVSAFAGTDLDMILRANDVDTLVLAGIATSGVVLSTTRHAADADYRLVIVRDCCADADEEVHRVLSEKVFPRQATVMTAEALMKSLA